MSKDIDYQKKMAELRDMEEAIKLKHGLPHLFGFPFYNWSRRVFESKNREILLTSANQVGKALCVDTDIPTPDGFKKMGDLRVGDLVFNQSGNPTKIIAIPFDGWANSYELTFDDGDKVIASEDHLWVCKGRLQRRRDCYNGKDNWTVKSTSEIRDNYINKTGHNDKTAVPLCRPVDYSGSKDLFDPYFVGLFIGNGCASQKSIIFNNLDADIKKYALYGGLALAALLLLKK